MYFRLNGSAISIVRGANSKVKKWIKGFSVLVLLAQLISGMPLAVQADTLTEPDQEAVVAVASTEESKESETPASTTESSVASPSDSSTPSSSESSTVPSSSESSTAPSTSSTTSSSEATVPSSQKPPKTEESSTSSSREEVAPPASSTQDSGTQGAPVQEAPIQETAPTQEIQSAGNDSNEMTGQAPTGPIASSVQDGVLLIEADESVESFIRKIGESARKIGQEEDLYASVMIAQAVLESASGQSTLAQAPNYNLFGIKGSYKGKSVSMATQEDNGSGELYGIQSAFRRYENYEACFEDYATLMKKGITGNEQYYAGAWKSNAKTYQDATKFLTGRYATDSRYNQKLNGLIETYQLTEYDKAIQGPPVSASGYKAPLAHYTISSGFGDRGGEFHRGLDLAASQGEPIHASKAGVVVVAATHPSWGNYTVIVHADGMTTLYAHQQQFIVHVGDSVVQGQTIGYVGSTGNSTGPHLHIEVCRDQSLAQGALLNPQEVLF